jgi:hypothetical protein
MFVKVTNFVTSCFPITLIVYEGPSSNGLPRGTSMPTIQISDTLSGTINSVPVNPSPLDALVKYVQNPAIDIVLLPDLVNALNGPLSAATATPLSTGLNFSTNISLGAGVPELSIAAGATQAVNVNCKAGSDLFSSDPFGSPVVVQAGEGYLSLALAGTVNPSISGNVGQLSFGVNASGSIGIEYFRNFAVTATQPTVAGALGAVLSDFVIPADVGDLTKMGKGDIAVVSGSGSLKLSASVTVSATPNPLATPNLPFINQPLTVKTGASLTLAGSYAIAGSYKIRVRKTDDGVVELGYYRDRNSQWSVSATASASVGVSLGSTDLLSKLLSGLSGTPEADLAAMIKVGLTDDEIKQIQTAISNSIDHSLQASLQVTLNGSNDSDAAFLYQIQLANLDATASHAVSLALDGDLSAMVALEPNDNGKGVVAPGVTMLRSAMSDTRKRGTSLKVNLFGILNFTSWSTLVSSSQFLFEPVTGELVVNQTINGTRFSDLSLPDQAEKLRKLMFDSMMTTAAYRATGALATMQLSSSDMHYAFNQNTNEHTMSDYLDGIVAVDLLTAAGKANLLNSFTGTGASHYLLRAQFDDAASQSMYLNAGTARPQSDYVVIARSALAMLLMPGDSNDSDKYRRDILGDDQLWAKMEDSGQPGFAQLLPGLNNVQVAVVTSDYTNVMWWAEAMGGTAKILVQVKALIASTPPGSLGNNNNFIKLTSSLQKHLADVTAKSRLSFGLPFGLVSLFKAATGAVASASIVSPAITQTFLAAKGAKIRHASDFPA